MINEGEKKSCLRWRLIWVDEDENYCVAMCGTREEAREYAYAVISGAENEKTQGWVEITEVKEEYREDIVYSKLVD